MFVLESNYLKKLFPHLKKRLPQVTLLQSVEHHYFSKQDICLLDEESVKSQGILQAFGCQIILFVSDQEKEKPGIIYKYQPFSMLLEKIMGRQMNITFICSYSLAQSQMLHLYESHAKASKEAYHVNLLLSDETNVNIFDYAISNNVDKEKTMKNLPTALKLYSNIHDYITPCEDAILDLVKRCATRNRTYVYTNFLKNTLDQKLLNLSSKVIVLCEDKGRPLNPSFLFEIQKSNAALIVSEFEEFESVVNKEDKGWMI